MCVHRARPREKIGESFHLHSCKNKKQVLVAFVMMEAFFILLFSVCVVGTHANGRLVQWKWDGPEKSLDAYRIPQLNYAFGYDLGAAFASGIQHVAAVNSNLQDNLLPAFCGPTATNESRATYAAFLRRNNATFPRYMQELEGIADGSGVSFEALFLSQMSEEFSYFMPPRKDGRTAPPPPEHCTDVMLKTGDEAYLVHNEDEQGYFLNYTILATVRGLRENFVAYVYLGQIPTGAFGWNGKRVAFTMNYVAPSSAEMGGLGRSFIARDMLESQSIDDAIKRATVPHQCAGHNYQIVSLDASRRIINVEVASFGRYAVSELTANPPSNVHFHVNQYQLLNISQRYSNSSPTDMQRCPR